jgi:hypothetical protein
VQHSPCWEGTTRRAAQSRAGQRRSNKVSIRVPTRGPAGQVYWLDVDYLAAAAAALRCGACFTALLYLEHWCEAAHGRLTLGDDLPLAAVRPRAARGALPATQALTAAHKERVRLRIDLL